MGSGALGMARVGSLEVVRAMNWLKRLFCRHFYVAFHPSAYQEHVRVFRCSLCGHEFDLGVRGESGHRIPYAFDVRDNRPLHGYPWSFWR